MSATFAQRRMDGQRPETVIICEPITTDDGAGGGSTTYPTARTVPGRIRLASLARNDERVIAEQVSTRVLWIVALPVDTPVSSAAQLTIGDRRFAVTAVLGPRTSEVSRRIACVELGD